MKKSLLLLVAMIATMTAWSQQTFINIIEQNAKITRTSTLYVGEVVLDGQQSFNYLYSEDITNTSRVFGAVRYSLTDFKDGIYSALVPNDADWETEDRGIAICSNSAYESKMNSDWMSAANAGQACLPNTTVTSSSSVDLYETDSDFASKCQSDDLEEAVVVDTFGNTLAVSGVLGVLSATNTDAVTYTVVDGVLIKTIDRIIDYSCESVTVIYTKAELKTTSTGVEDINAAQPRSGQRYNVMGQPVGKDYRGIVIEDGKKLIIK